MCNVFPGGQRIEEIVTSELQKRSIFNLLNKAIKRLYEQDRELLTNKVSERCVCARLAHHMECIKQENAYTFLEKYYVDVEYDRMEDSNPKHIVNNTRKNVCDLLIHSRGHEEKDNMLALEMKVRDNYSNKRTDIERLKALVAPPNEENKGTVCNTLMGVLLCLKSDKYQFNLYVDGDEAKGDEISI